MTTPTLTDLLAGRGISGLEAAVLEAVWRGKGMPVTTERLFDAMYADDPDGGPSPTNMYRDLKRALTRLEGVLDGSGVSLVQAGYRQGLRLQLADNAASE